ncbi:MAG: C10 family peptidase [Bacteroidaceae bacterium]|nr:C10 family peptidase [Bacteroidaceae bacterium]
MKQFLHSLAITLCFALMATGAQAQTITAEQAKEIANKFFQNGKQKSAAARSTVSLAKSADSRILSNGSSNEAPTFHILTPASGEGFVIVSGEEIENPIIGYSLDGTIDTSNLPDGFVDYITDIDAQVKALRKYNAENPQKAAAARSAMQKTNYNATTMGNKVYLETASWGQGYPFNAQCFTSYNGSTNAATGCVPTAYAIVMRYHGFPTEGTAKTLYNCQAPTYVEITDRVYDFSKMPLTYNSNWTQEQIDEVSKFFSHVLHACFPSSIGTGATTVNEGQTSKVLNDYFNYQLINASYQANFTMDSWEEKIKESIDNGCPIPYASDNSGTGDTRHMFVVDGYTANDYFHFNFGWYGNGNGWFKLDAITPSQGDNYSWQSGAEHYALFNLAPNRTMRTVTASVSPAGAGTVTVNGSANSAEVMEGTRATLVATANSGYTFSQWSKDGAQVSTEKTYKATVAAEGNDYVANFLTVGNTTVNVSVEYNSSYGTVTGTSGTVANGTTLTPRLNEEVTLTATPLDGYVFNGWTVTKGTESTNYSGTSLTFVATGVMSVTANFALAETDYIIDNTTGTTLTTSRVNYWEHNAIKLTLSTDDGGIAYNGYISLFAGASGSETYTLTAPTGYTITKYKFSQCRSQSTSSTYNLSIVADAEYPLTTSEQDITISNVNAATAQFTVKGDAGRSMYTKQIIVTLKKDGAGSGSTPTPTQYTITATANPGTAGSVTGGGTYTEGATVTLTATPNSGYEFVNWTSGTTTVSTNATYSFTANASASYVANFQAAALTTFAVTTTANPAAGGTATFAVGTGQATTSANVASGTGVTLYAVANNGYRFVNWTKGGMEVSTNATPNVTITEASDFVANFEEEATATEYPTPTGNTYTDNYLTSVTTTGANENITYTANAHPGNKVVTLPGTVRVEQGKSFTLNLVAKSLSSSTSSVYEDMRYCHASLFTDFDGDRTFGAAVQTWGSYKPSDNIAGNYSSVMNITHEITVPADAPLGTSHVRMIYTNAWKDWPANGTAELDKGIVYDIPVEVVEAYNEQTLNVTYSGATWNNEESSWWVSVVTNTTPAVTVKTTDGTPKIGYSTFNEVRHPYLLDGNSFTISVPANCKITGYRLGYKAHNLVSKSVTYTNGKQSTGTITIAQSNEENTLTVTGLDNNEISFSVEDQSSQAGFIIKSLEITYVENEFEPAMFKAEIEGWRDNNPNTHLGTITIGGTAMKLTPAHQTASELTMPVVEGTALAFTRKYRGFEFNGFYIGSTELGTNPTLTAENIAAIDENNPLIAKFTATDDVTLFYDDDEFSYRIPAIAKTDNGMLVAVSDYRHNLDDIGRDNHGTGTKRVDLVMRTSTDNGATWSETKTIAAGDNNMVGSYQRAYGDAAIAAVGQNIVVMAAAGDVVYTAGTTSSPNKMARIYSTDNGATWTIEEMTTKMYSQSTSLIPSGGSAFFGSGKLAVDPNFNGTGNARIYGALLVRIGTDGYNNFGVFSDDLGATWKILGGDNTNPVAKGDEPKVEILPNGQILLSARRGGGRVFRVFTYGDDKANGAGSWGDAAVNGCDNGGSNATNGEIICLDAKRPNGKPTKILLQSQPKGGSGQYDRRDVTIWYKEVSADETYTSATIASDWTMGKQVSTQLSAYSTMCLQANGEIALFFEEAPCYGDDYTKGYSMVYIPLTIEEITNDNFLNPNAVVETVTVDVTLTDEQGNTYTHQFDYLPGDAAAIDAALKAAYPFISELGEGNLQGSDTYYTYTNTVTLPFKVSNANTTVWHNIYWPSNGTSEGEFYPIYMMANADNATNVAKITEKVHYGNSQYNTYNYADKLGWAVYNVNNSFTFKFKNKLTGKFMAINGVVSNGNASNVIYTDETNATAFTLTKNTGTTYKGDFAITSVYNGTTGYVCSTSAGYDYATNYTGNGHHGAWAKIVESPDYWTIYEKLLADINDFGAGDGKYTENDAISSIDKDALGTMLFSDLTAQATAVQNVKDSYTEITLTVPAVNDIVPGSVKILDELVSHKFVPKGNVTIQAIPAAGYRFVNWTRPAAAASAAARTAEARNSDVVSTDNPYTVTVSEALSLEANFEQIVVNATLTDAEGNTYEMQVSGFTAEITKGAVAEKLREAYPYITLGTTDQEGDVIDFGVLNIDGTAYTYTNMVELPFRVTNTAYLWHNIYWPSNTKAYDYPVYLSASTADDIYVPKVTGSYAYGDHPTYNTKSGNDNISWAIYNVNNSFEFIFKNKVTQKYIKIINVATGNAQNVQYVENAEDATAFTIEMKPEGQTYDTDAKYALAAMFGETKGYLCSTSATGYNYATHYNSNGHQGAWIEFKEAPDYYSIIRDQGIILGIRFGAGDGKCIITDEISVINNDIANNSDNITFNTLNAYGLTMEDAMNNWPAVGLTINPAEGGTTNINGEENVVHKYVPNGYALPLAAVPAEGYHFVNWTDAGGNAVSTDAATTITMSGNKGDVIEFTANFAINTYTINVTAEGNGVANTNAATVEHGGEVTLKAVANDGYEFAGWYNGEEFVSAEATYTFNVTSDINYTARFNEAATGTVAIHITVASTDGTTVTNAEDGNVKAIFNNLGLPWPTSAEFTVGTDVNMVATEDYELKAYLFDGWYKDGELISKELEYTIKASENATYEARFFRGCVVVGKSNKNSMGYITQITYEDGTQIGLYAATTRVVVKEGTIVKINTFTNNGYRLGSWTDDESNEAGKEDNLVVEATEDVTYTANFEEAFYYLTVRANDDAYGSAEAESGTSSDTTVKVGLNMTATLRATNKDGYKFVNWTKGENVVSSDAEYTVPAIGNAANMADVEYVANFIEVEAAEAGVYYRIAYDFPAPAAAGSARYYMQSVASNVTGKANALLMTQETGAASIFYYADSKLLSYDKGTYIKEVGNTRGLQGIGVEGGEVTINTAGETSTIAATSYMHANSFTSGTNTTYFIDHCGSDNGDKEHNLVLEEVESLPVTISAAEHATLYAPVALIIPDGVKAYILKEQNFTAGTYATMTSLKNGIIPPNTGVILKGAPNNYDFVILDNDDTDVDMARVEAIGNVLEGTVAATRVTKDAYILASRNGKVGLYPLAGNSYLTPGGATPTFTNNSHKAYLPVEGNFGEILKNSNGFHFIFDDDNVTDIDGVEAEETETIYDLQGRKLIEITEPGIYIVNGKKMFVK